MVLSTLGVKAILDMSELQKEGERLKPSTIHTMYITDFFLLVTKSISYSDIIKLFFSFLFLGMSCYHDYHDD